MPNSNLILNDYTSEVQGCRQMSGEKKVISILPDLEHAPVISVIRCKVEMRASLFCVVVLQQSQTSFPNICL